MPKNPLAEFSILSNRIVVGKVSRQSDPLDTSLRAPNRDSQLLMVSEGNVILCD
jgi:hypothetical protein